MMRQVLQTLFSGLFALLIGIGTVVAVEPDERLDDPVLEERARDISQHLRCVVCQNQSIDDSSAPLARDLRIIIRERLSAGDSNDEVIQFVTQRYGDFVLLKPPFKGQTYLLWFGPFLILILGGGLIFYYYRKVLKAVPEKGSPAKGKKGKKSS